MNNQIKQQLLDKYATVANPASIDFCRDAYRFLTESDPSSHEVMDKLAQMAHQATPQAIDLGLPSGTLWCDRNVGAESPSDCGAYFSWGNTTPHYAHSEEDWGDDDEAFDEEYYDSDYYEKTDGYKLKGNIDLDHDAARVNIGEPWQMPTTEQFKELYDHCTWRRHTRNGMNGYLVTSKSNGNSIFLPCSGHGSGASRDNRGSHGYYWSASLGSATNGRYLHFSSGGVNSQYNGSRFYGLTVRPVQ